MKSRFKKCVLGAVLLALAAGAAFFSTGAVQPEYGTVREEVRYAPEPVQE